MLVEAGFSPGNPGDTLCEEPIQQTGFHNTSTMYYDWKTWARTHHADGRLPLFTAVAKSLKWLHTRQIFIANMPLVQEVDVQTRLPLFMLAAVGMNSDIESTYNLLKEYPPAISSMNYMHQKSSTDNV